MKNTSKRFAPNRLQDYSKSAIIEEIFRVIRDECGGIVPTRDEFEKLSRVKHPTIAKHYGTYTEAIKQAGFTLHKHASHVNITAEQVKADLFEVLKRVNGHYFTRDFYRQNGSAYSESVVKARLGVKNWQSVMQAIGAEKRQRIKHSVVSIRAQRRNYLSNITEIDLFNEISRIWDIKGRRPSSSEFSKESKLGISIYRTRYGSWTKAIDSYTKVNNVRAQGLTHSRPTKDILIQELREAQNKCPGAILKYDKYKDCGGTYSRGVFTAQFGSWTKAVNSIGGVSGEQARYSKDQLFNEIQRLWEQYGRQPTQAQMWKQGNISPKCYTKLFGSWTNAIHAFCKDRSDNTAVTVIQADDLKSTTSIKPEALVKSPDIPDVKNTSIIIEHNTGRTVSLKLRFMVYKRDNFTCIKCRRSPATNPGLELEVDHNTPYSSGGETELDNLQTLCRECNRRKSNR